MSITPMAGGDFNDAAAGEKEKPTRKFPLPCWTQEETLSLIEAYRERWYALRRGYLRTADWDAVAAAVTDRCPGATPAKTSAQCRHKMEKLRQRYRAERQRSLAFPPGRFFSSWFFFENMDAMENGTTLDQNVMKLKISNDMKSGADHEMTVKKNCTVNDVNNGKTRSIYDEGKVLNGYSSYVDKEEDEMGFQVGYPLKLNNRVGGCLAPKVFGGENYSREQGNSTAYNVGLNSSGGRGFDGGDGIQIKSIWDESLLPPRLRVRGIGKTDGRANRVATYADDSDEMNANEKVSAPTMLSNGRNAAHLGNSGGYLDLNGFYSERVERGKNGGMKRERTGMEEMVVAIKMLGEGLMKMEEMKMEMAMKIEKNRMEMEMKRNEYILQSQRQIVDAFAHGFLESNKKLKVSTLSES